MDPIKIIEAMAILTLGAWSGWKEVNDRRRRKFEYAAGLKANPTRCAEHAEKINDLILDVRAIKDHLGIV